MLRGFIIPNPMWVEVDIKDVRRIIAIIGLLVMMVVTKSIIVFFFFFYEYFITFVISS